MGLLFDTLRGWLSPSVEGRLAGRAALVGRMVGSEPVRVGHPALALPDAQVWHCPKGRLPVASTFTVGLAEARGHELIAFTLADTRTPASEPMARVLAAAADAAVGEVVPLPDGALGRSAHRFALVAGPPAYLDPDRLRDWEAVLGGALRMVLTLTEAEREWVAAHGHDAYLARIGAQGVPCCCDRRPGDVDLS